jgi:predicted DNA-binding transcriptional regulator YafY
LELLQSGGLRTVGELADRLEVDPRTVRRYVEHLLDLGVPVETVRGRYGGYRLARGFRLPPLMLDEEEALAVVLGLSTGHPSLPAETAAAKVRRVLPDRVAHRLDALLASLSVAGPLRPTGPEGSVLLPLADAVRHHRPVSFRYTDRAGSSSDRELQPHGVVVHADRWYVTGLDPVAGASRTFRLDRVSAVRNLPGSFDPPADPVSAEAVVAGFADADHRWTVLVRVDADPDLVRDRLPASVARVTADGAGTRVEIHAERLDWVPRVLAALDVPFAVQEPAELRELVRAFARRVSSAARRVP